MLGLRLVPHIGQGVTFLVLARGVCGVFRLLGSVRIATHIAQVILLAVVLIGKLRCETRILRLGLLALLRVSAVENFVFAVAKRATIRIGLADEHGLLALRLLRRGGVARVHLRKLALLENKGSVIGGDLCIGIDLTKHLH